VIPLLILRPEPGATATAERARTMGLHPIMCPLFRVAPRAWDAPDPAQFDCLALTSANAARHAGPALVTYAALSAFTVGDATAAAAREAGLTNIVITHGDAAALFAEVGKRGLTRPLHLAGEDFTPYPALPFTVATRIVYAAELVEIVLPAPPYVALLHSVRAAQRFADLVPDRTAIAVVTISDQVAAAAGHGWRSLAIAPEPSDASMLALAAQLCESTADDA
jgi:uroporphyrinogen-III synthase